MFVHRAVVPCPMHCSLSAAAESRLGLSGRCAARECQRKKRAKHSPTLISRVRPRAVHPAKGFSFSYQPGTFPRSANCTDRIAPVFSLFLRANSECEIIASSVAILTRCAWQNSITRERRWTLVTAGFPGSTACADRSPRHSALSALFRQAAGCFSTRFPPSPGPTQSDGLGHGQRCEPSVRQLPDALLPHAVRERRPDLPAGGFGFG